MTFTQLASRNQNRLTVTASTIGHWPKVQLRESARRVRNEEQVVPLSACVENLARNGVNRCGPFVALANRPGSDIVCDDVGAYHSRHFYRSFDSRRASRGQDRPHSKCERTNKTNTKMGGSCGFVCKDLVIAQPARLRPPASNTSALEAPPHRPQSERGML